MAQPEYASKKDSAAGNAQQIMPHEQISTQGALQNSSPSTLHYVLCHDWEGLVSLEAQYPPFIESHKCCKFVHVGETIWVWSIGSVAAVVYRGGPSIPGGKMMDWLLAWSNHPSSPNCTRSNNKVYTEIAEPGTPWNWEFTRKKLDEGQSFAKCEWNGYQATLTIGQGASANLEGTITF